MITIINKIRTKLKENSNEKTRLSSQHFFKDKIKCYGVTTPNVQKIAKEVFKEIKDKSKTEIFDMCEVLFKSGYIEESFVACNWSHALHKKFTPTDFKTFKKWIENYIANWATCDTFCNHTVGAFVQMYPEFILELKKFTKSKNRWIRRASAVSLIIPVKRGFFLNDVFDIATTMLLDQDDMVQKGYGWMLKVASAKHQKEVFDFVYKHKSVMPRTALRYAIEKMPVELRKKAMTKI